MQAVVVATIVAGRRTYWGEDDSTKKRTKTKGEIMAGLGSGCPGFKSSDVTLGTVA